MFDRDVIDEGSTMPTKPGKMVAMLYMMNKRQKYGESFTKSDICNVLTVLQSAPLSIVACQKFIEQGVYVSRLDGLTEMARMDLRTITLGLLSDRLVILSGAARGTVFCVDEVKEELFFIVDTAAGTKREIRIPLTPKSIAGFAIIEKVTINIPDCYRDPRFNPSTDRATGFRTNQMLCVPLTNHEGRCLGAIQLINSRQGMSFDDNDQKLLEAFAVYVQAAIENLRNKGAVECAHKQVATSIKINSGMSNAFDAKALFDVAFQQTCEAAGCDYMAIYIPVKNEVLKDKYLRHDSKGAWSKVVTIRPNCMTHAAAIKNSFMNVCIAQEEVVNNRLELVDVYHGVKGQRAWVGSMPPDVQPVCVQSSSKEVHCVQDIDFPLETFKESKWTNLLMIPLATAEGNYALQLAGKSDAQCFTVADEELLLLIGQQLVIMIQQLAYVETVDGEPILTQKMREVKEENDEETW